MMLGGVPIVSPMTYEWCAESLSDADGFGAICTRPWGTEHTHHDLSAREAVRVGVAAEGCFDCAGAEGDPDRTACSNCDRDWSPKGAAR